MPAHFYVSAGAQTSALLDIQACRKKRGSRWKAWHSRLGCERKSSYSRYFFLFFLQLLLFLRLALFLFKVLSRLDFSNERSSILEIIKSSPSCRFIYVCSPGPRFLSGPTDVKVCWSKINGIRGRSHQPASSPLILQAMVWWSDDWRWKWHCAMLQYLLASLGPWGMIS